MNNIIDPTSGVSYSIFSNEGISLLKQYVSLYQSGGKDSVQNMKLLKIKEMLEAHPNERIKRFVSYYEDVFSNVSGDYKGIMFALNNIENELDDENKLNDKDDTKLLEQIKNHNYYLIHSLADPDDGILLKLDKRMKMLLGIENEDKLFEFIKSNLTFPGIKQFQNTFKLLEILREYFSDNITIKYYLQNPEYLVNSLEWATEEEGLGDLKMLQTVDFIVVGVKKLYEEAEAEAEAARRAAEAAQQESDDNAHNRDLAGDQLDEPNLRAILEVQANIAPTSEERDQLWNQLNNRPTVLERENN